MTTHALLQRLPLEALDATDEDGDWGRAERPRDLTSGGWALYSSGSGNVR
jgi:hypothetical protein